MRTGAAVAARAVRVAAEHVDAVGVAIDPIELDRLRSILRAVPETSAREAALERLAAVERAALARDAGARDEALATAAGVSELTARTLRRARSVLAGAGAGARGAEDDTSLAAAALDVVVALRDARPRDAALALGAARRLAANAPAGADRPAWTSAALGLASDEAFVREEAAALAEQLLARPSPSPPRGVTDLAAALTRAGRDDLALVARRIAALRRERGAREALWSATIARAWHLASEDRREEARSLLRAARDASHDGARDADPPPRSR